MGAFIDSVRFEYDEKLFNLNFGSKKLKNNLINFLVLNSFSIKKLKSFLRCFLKIPKKSFICPSSTLLNFQKAFQK